ncbi:SDR family NAD(P)-dependent oxidoreductase, partial [Candidatus Woesearchaeota archaeon]|nr:SDR family NAD(P)-dependent oxidoreductase [Candidatus Woesearchaeota archaeon]
QETEPELKKNKISDLKRIILSLQSLDTADREKVSVPEEEEIWITDDKTSLTENIEKKLASAGYSTKIISIDGLPKNAPSSLGGLLILAPKGADDNFLVNSFKLLQLAAPGLRACGKKSSAVFATVSCLDGGFGLKGLDADSEPLTGGLAGLSKTASHEWPEVNCKAIDIAPDYDASDDIINEIFLKGPEEVGISKQGRVSIELSSSQIDSSAKGFPLKQGEVIAITGGARGVTAECAVAFANKRPTLVLLGRSKPPVPEPDWLAPLTNEAEIKRQIMLHAGKNASPKLIGEEYRKLMANREMLKNISRIESAGAKAVYRSVDVRDADKLKNTLDEISSSLGPVKGLIHGAGVIADKLIEDKTDEEFDRVYGTKVEGLKNLLNAIKKEELKFIVLFSSSTGRYGRTGQVDYSIANEVLNKIAQQHAKLYPSCRVVSPNWGPWDGGMVTPSLKQLFEKEGVGVIPLEAGAEYLVEEVSSDGPVEVVILGNLPGEKTEPIEPTKTKQAEPTTDLSVSFEREISAEGFPVLKSHVIDGKAVLPVALMIEMLAHGAMHVNPGLIFHGFNELRVLKGIRLNGNESVTISVLSGKAVKKDDSFVVPVELKSSSQGKEFRNAQAEIMLATALPEGKSRLSGIDTQPSQRLSKNFYDDFLFHGPDMQGITKIDGCSKQGMTATCNTAPDPSSWIENPLRSNWISDPLLLDCSFQMMILWSFDNLGAGSLPTYAKNYRQFMPFPKDSARINVNVIESSSSKAVADIEFIDDKEGLIARMEKYECIVDTSLKKTFENNRLVITD